VDERVPFSVHASSDSLGSLGPSRAGERRQDLLLQGLHRHSTNRMPRKARDARQRPAMSNRLAFVITRKGGRAVECTGLENRQAGNPRLGGSNPPPSVSPGFVAIVRTPLRPSRSRCYQDAAGAGRGPRSRCRYPGIGTGLVSIQSDGSVARGPISRRRRAARRERSRRRILAINPGAGSYRSSTPSGITMSTGRCSSNAARAKVDPNVAESAATNAVRSG
jgi:hypothetical protein